MRADHQKLIILLEWPNVKAIMFILTTNSCLATTRVKLSKASRWWYLTGANPGIKKGGAHFCYRKNRPGRVYNFVCARGGLEACPPKF